MRRREISRDTRERRGTASTWRSLGRRRLRARPTAAAWIRSRTARTSTRATSAARRARRRSRSTRRTRGNVIAGSNEIQRLPMRAMASTDGGATFTGVDLPLPPPRTNNGFDFGSDPGVAFDSNGNAYYSYIVVFFSTGGCDQRHGDGRRAVDRRRRDLDGDVLRTHRPGTRQFNDKPMITVDTGSGPPQPHLRRVGQRDRQLLVRQERQQRRPFVFRRRRRHVLLTRLGQRAVHRQDRRHRRRPVRHARTGRCTSRGRTTRTAMIADVASTDGGLTFSPPHIDRARWTRSSSTSPRRRRAARSSTRMRRVRAGALLLVHERQRRGTNVFVAKSTDGGVDVDLDRSARRRRPVQPVAGRRPVERLRQRRLLRHGDARGDLDDVHAGPLDERRARPTARRAGRERTDR